MSPYVRAIWVFFVIVAAAVLAVWGIPAIAREKPQRSGMSSGIITATAPLPVGADRPDVGVKERYGEPPGMLRAVHRDELGFRGWADMPGDYEGSSASAVSAYIERSA